MALACVTDRGDDDSQPATKFLHRVRSGRYAKRLGFNGVFKVPLVGGSYAVLQ